MSDGKILHEALAHSQGHFLKDHLLKVAQLSFGFVGGWENPKNAAFVKIAQDWVYLAGLWHDLGKYRVGFQKYLASQSENENAHLKGENQRVSSSDKTHSTAGALWAIKIFENSPDKNVKLSANVLAYLIASHHAGLYDYYYDDDTKMPDLQSRLFAKNSQIELIETLAAKPSDEILHPMQSQLANLPKLNIPGKANGFALWLRLLFSALVDADFLDTEAHFDHVKKERNSAIRSEFVPLEKFLPCFDAYMTQMSEQVKKESKQKAEPLSLVNQLRSDILIQCQNKAELGAGFFSLTVPTGGGKTLSSLAFALRHAKIHGHKRIIYAIPYTSIIEQTASTFRKVFAELLIENPMLDVLIEHHSQFEAKDGTDSNRSRLASENWDAPLIVTTNVQLFESLFAAKTSRCRKLHRLVNSVIILDEAQQLPPEFLQPILNTLKLLVEHYGVSVVFCTATQPALTTTNYFDPRKNLNGIKNAQEIMSDPDSLFAQLERVKVELPADWNQTTSWLDLSEQIKQEDCVLVIVNQRNDAKVLFELIQKDDKTALHLSALMCGAHRSDVIEQIKARLKAKREGNDKTPLRVIATSLVEAGVDLDFPVVFRAMAGLDSIAQAGGRCNREGLLPEKGRVIVFIPEGKPHKGITKNIDECKSVLSEAQNKPNFNPLDRALFASYFTKLYCASNLDEKGIEAMLKMDLDTLAVQFRSAAEKFKLIDDGGQISVIVRYQSPNDASEKEDKNASIEADKKESQKSINYLLMLLKTKGANRDLMRKLQRFTVNIPIKIANKLIAQGVVTEMVSSVYVQKNADHLYDERLGLLIGVHFDAAGNVL